MPKPSERVQLNKQESPHLGGGSDPDDFEPFLYAPLNPDEDAPEVGGLFFQVSGVRDNIVVIYRENNQMWFEDAFHSGSNRVNLNDLLGSGITGTIDHPPLRHLIHFIDEGPACGFGTTASKTITGGLFPTYIEWKDSDNNLIVSKDIERNISPATKLAPTPIIWKMYDTDGETVLCTIQDDIVYTGILETSRTRTII